MLPSGSRHNPCWLIAALAPHPACPGSPTPGTSRGNVQRQTDSYGQPVACDSKCVTPTPKQVCRMPWVCSITMTRGGMRDSKYRRAGPEQDSPGHHGPSARQGEGQIGTAKQTNVLLREPRAPEVTVLSEMCQWAQRPAPSTGTRVRHLHQTGCPDRQFGL